MQITCLVIKCLGVVFGNVEDVGLGDCGVDGHLDDPFGADYHREGIRILPIEIHIELRLLREETQVVLVKWQRWVLRKFENYTSGAEMDGGLRVPIVASIYVEKVCFSKEVLDVLFTFF